MRQVPLSPLSFDPQRVANVPEHPPPSTRLMSCAHIANRQLSRIIGARHSVSLREGPQRNPGHQDKSRQLAEASERKSQFLASMSHALRTPEGLERSRRANWKHGHFSREAKAERSRVRAAILAVRHLRDSI